MAELHCTKTHLVVKLWEETVASLLSTYWKPVMVHEEILMVVISMRSELTGQ